MSRLSFLCCLLLFPIACATPKPGAVPDVDSHWYEVVEEYPGDRVQDEEMRRRIVESGLPWMVRDKATGIEMVLILPGEFEMGSPPSEAQRDVDEGPAHRVRISRAFYLGVTEVTQGQWEKVMGMHQSNTRGKDLPVDGIPFLAVEGLIAKVNQAVPTGGSALRLPTEAEWEYACRAGTRGPYSFTDPIGHGLVNFNDGDVKHAVMENGTMTIEWNRPPAPEARLEPTTAGILPANPWGLHDMHGSLWEWTSDNYLEEGYPDRGDLTVDPWVRTEEAGLRALRGGSFWDSAWECRSASRDFAAPFVSSARIGFRLARSV